MRVTLAVIAGFVATFILATGTDLILTKAFPGYGHLHPVRMQAAGMIYTLVFAAVGGFATARIARTRPMLAAVILAGIAFAISAAVLIPAPAVPVWSKIGSLVLLFPFTLLGGYVASRRQAEPRAMAAAH